jgi:hypothetical protein
VDKGRPKLKYRLNRTLDDKNEIITVTEVTTGSVNEAHRIKSLATQALQRLRSTPAVHAQLVGPQP